MPLHKKPLPQIHFSSTGNVSIYYSLQYNPKPSHNHLSQAAPPPPPPPPYTVPLSNPPNA